MTGLHTIARQSLRTLGMSVVQVLLGLITSVIVARALGPQERGIYALFVLIATGLATLLNPGIYAAANYFVGTGQLTPAAGYRATLDLAALTAVLGAAAAIPAAWVLGLPTPAGFAAALAALTLAQIVINSFNGLFYGAGRVAAITRWKIVWAALVCLAFVLAAVGGTDALACAWLFAMLNAIDAIAVIVLFRRSITVEQPPTGSARAMLRYGIPVYASRALLFLGQRLDGYLVFLLAGAAALGQYGIAVTLAEQIWLLPTSVGLIMMATIGKLDTQAAAGATMRVIRTATALIIPAAIVLLICIPLLVPLLYGAPYTAAGFAFLLLLPGTALVGLCNLAEPFFQSRGRPDIPLLTCAAGLGLNLTGNLLLIPQHGMLGAAVAASVAYSIQAAITLVLFVRMGEVRWRELLGLDYAYRAIGCAVIAWVATMRRVS